MQYQILANKWRPKNFSEIVEQKYIIRALKNSLINNNIHHSYIFSGTRGIGKTTIARLFAKSLNCINFIKKINFPCNNCIICKEIDNNNFIDLIEVDAASKTRIEDIREILDQIQYLPVKGNFKIYLIDEAHMLSKYSFNALLKNLEEPPPHVKFFLATTEPNKIPITILSRCIQFNLKPLNIKKIFLHLKFILNHENIQSEEKALYLIARNSHGSMRDAITLLEQAIAIKKAIITTQDIEEMIGGCNENEILDLILNIINNNGVKLMKLINQILIDNVDGNFLLNEILRVLHLIFTMQILPEKNFFIKINGNEKKIKSITEKITPEKVKLYYKMILEGKKNLQLSPDYKIGVEMIFLEILYMNIDKNKIFNKKNKKYHETIFNKINASIEKAEKK